MKQYTNKAQSLFHSMLMKNLWLPFIGIYLSINNIHQEIFKCNSTLQAYNKFTAITEQKSISIVLRGLMNQACLHLQNGKLHLHLNQLTCTTILLTSIRHAQFSRDLVPAQHLQNGRITHLQQFKCTTILYPTSIRPAQFSRDLS